jgi:hypothetical protein
VHAVTGVDVIFEQYRDAVQRPTWAALETLTIQPGGDLFGIRVGLDNRSQRRPVPVDRVDPLKVPAYQRECGKAA